MKQLSLSYKNSQTGNLVKPFRKVELFRRLPGSMTWENLPIDITPEIITLERLSWKLDTEALNEFKASNLRIEVENTKKQWSENSERFNGFLLYQSKIKLWLGINNEFFPCWLGFIDDVIINSNAPLVQLELKSIEQLLDNIKAKDAAIKINNELLGIGDGIKSEFELSEFPVGDVKEVRVGGEFQRPGTRWSVSNLNDINRKAVIKFDTVQPEPGKEVRADYIVWKRDKQSHEIVNDLLDLAPYLSKEVEQVNFEPPAEREIIHTYQSDFERYTLHNAIVISDDEPPEDDGQITINGFDTEQKWRNAFNINRINFKRIKNGIHPLWTSQYEADYPPQQEKVIIENDYTLPWSETLPSSSTAELSDSVRTVTHNGGADYVLYNQAEEFGLSRCICARLKFTTLNGRVTLGTTISQAPYLGAQIEFTNINQIRVRSGSLSQTYNINLSQFHVFRLALEVSNPNSGIWRLYIDGNQVLSGSLGTLAGGTSGVRLQSTTASNNTFHIDYIRYNGISPLPASGEIAFKIDYGAELSGLTTFSLINTLGPFFAELQGLSNSSKFYYSWSQDDVNYTAETESQNTGNIGNWNNTHSPRYIKFRIVLTDKLESSVSGIKRLWLPAIATSPAIDGGSGIISWDSWKLIGLNNDGSIQRFTASSTNLTPSGFGFHRSVASDNLIKTDEYQQSLGFGVTQKMCFITLMNTNGSNPPVHKTSIIKLITKNVLITMANFGNNSVLSILKELAKIADFEIGINGEGCFFFRNKHKQAEPVITLDANNIEKINSISYGYDRVYNSIMANFGKFYKLADSSTENEPEPSSITKFGTRVLSVGSSGMLFESDVDLATVMAKRYFNSYKTPKKRITLTARFMPELELSDVVHLKLQAFNYEFLPEFNAKITGIAHDLMNFKTELDLLEL